MKRIFFEVLQESDINDVKKNFLLEQTFEVIFEPSPTITFEELKVGKKDSRHYEIKLIIEKRGKAYLERFFDESIKPLISKPLKKKLACESLKFEFIEKETYELSLKKLKEIEENSKKFKDEIEIEKIEISESEKEGMARTSVWQSVIDNQSKIKEGYIYILSNRALPKIYKIGFVKEDVAKRAYSFKRETKLDTDFVIEKTWKTKNPFEVEQKIFESLEMPTNEKGEFDSSLGKCYRNSKFINGKRFSEFVDGASLKFFCKRIEEFIQE